MPLAPLPGPTNLFQLVTKQATMAGFMTHLMHQRYPEAHQQRLDWIEQGKLLNREHMLQGIESMPTAFCGLLAGRNFGKTMVALSQAVAQSYSALALIFSGRAIHSCPRSIPFQ